MRFPFFRNRDSVKNGILISIRRTGDGFHPGLFTIRFAKSRMRESRTSGVLWGVYDRKGCTYSTYESIRGMNIRKPERICGEAVCSFRFLCYRKLLCYANGREIWKVEPPPGVSSTEIVPLWSEMISYAIHSPRPKCCLLFLAESAR